LIPFAAVITPATLSVYTDLQNSTVTGAYLNFSDPLFAVVVDLHQYPGNPYANAYERPDILVTRLSLATAVQGSILSIPPPLPNSSYSLEFDGPALKCDDANSTELDMFAQAYKDWAALNWGSVNYLMYAAWVGYTMGFLNITCLNSQAVCGSRMLASLDNGVPEPKLTTIYVAGNRNSSAGEYIPNNGTGDWSSAPDFTLLKCVLHNTSYVVDVNLHDRTEQLVKVRKKEYLNPISALGSFSRAENNTVEFLNYQSLMDCLGRILVGAIISSPIPIMSGPVNDDPYILTSSTQFLLTSLVEAADLQNDETFALSLNDSTSEPALLNRHRDWYLKDGVEELFQNMTLSLLSAPRFQ
jgi:hypothetical protein